MSDGNWMVGRVELPARHAVMGANPSHLVQVGMTQDETVEMARLLLGELQKINAILDEMMAELRGVKTGG